MGGGWSEIFFTMNPNLRGGGVGAGVGLGGRGGE